MMKLPHHPGFQFISLSLSRPRNITLVPDGDTISFTYRSGWASFDAKALEIHSVYRIEL